MASSSRYRAGLLNRLGLAFEVVAPKIDESPKPDESPQHTAERLSLEKARAVAIQYPSHVTIGSDQVAELGGVAIGKPGSKEAARQQLQQMRGQALTFFSGVAVVVHGEREESLIVATKVRFRRFTDSQIESYLVREPAYDCAGSAKCEGLGIALMESIESDDPTALIGLPLVALTTMLDRAGISVL